MSAVPESDLLQLLLAHDRWATEQILHPCEGLPEEAFHRRFDVGPGSLHDTLTHVIGVVRTFADTLAGAAEPRPRLETDGRRRTPGELRALLDGSWGEFAAEARRRPVDEVVERRLRDGRVLRVTRTAVFAHVATHGAHHRAQCLNMLRQLGVKPLPASSVAEWAMTGEPRG
jgi:uncharacterized damage-inducible protein DinB